MLFIGIDLAWGELKPTGVAVVDEAGALLGVTTMRTDDEIASFLEPFIGSDCLVAIDAPLVVNNATGNRPAEALLNQDFRAFEAGAHPSNTGKAEFAKQPRGARLAERLDLDIDPHSRAQRRAIEVYPHPATIALFRLGRTLKYKNKTGRSTISIQSELLQLMGHLESLHTAVPPLHLKGNEQWAELVAAVTHATRKSELRVVEDQVDAVLCAYVAAYASRRPADITTYGDLAEGYIVTPTLPADLAPHRHASPPEPVVGTGPSPSEVSWAIATYARRRPDLVRAGDQFTQLVTTMLDDAGINYLTITGRTKSVESFAGKAHRTVEGEPLYTDPLAEITDQIGVRVITYVLSDVTAVADLLSDQLGLLSDRDMGQETASEGRFGYASRHLLIALPDGTPAQVQIRTVLQHAWAEFEHDIRYKGTVPEEHAPDLDRRFTLAAGLLELADREFSTIRDRLQADMSADHAGRLASALDDDPRISAQELASFLAGQYADAGWSRTDHYAWISGLLLELGISSLEELRGVLNTVDGVRVATSMGYRYPPGAVRRLDDALLATYGEDYVLLTGNRSREELLRNRLAKLTGGDVN